MVKLIIAEKPSVAKEIAKVVGAQKRVSPGKDARYGYLEGNGYYVSWCFGHLVQTAYPEAYNEDYKVWDVRNLPILPSVWKYTTDGPGKTQYNVLKKLLNSKDVSSVICATDADREGELIFRLVYNESKSTKPIERLWISSMEASAIRKGLNSLKPGAAYDNLYHAASARQKADWIIGLNATRYYTARFCQMGTQLNIGRVQTPTVNLIVQRQQEIDNFVPEAYYVLTANTGSFKATLKEKDKTLANSKIAKCNGKDGVISAIKTEKKKSSPPALYDLTHLQQDADKMFGFSASETLKIVQKLYEDKMLTYPRTDSQYLSSDMLASTKKIVSAFLGNGVVGNDVLKAYNSQVPNVDQVVNDKKVSGHHAIIPTMTATTSPLSALSDRERKIFLMVLYRLLAAVCVPYEYLSTKASLKIEDEIFTANGKQTLIAGWTDIVSSFKSALKANSDDDKADTDSDDEQSLPPLNEGDVFKRVSVTGEEKFTQPPAVYTEATLLKDMQNISKRIENADLRAVMSKVDDNGNKKMLGTAATQGSIIEKIIATGYIEKKGRKLRPTEKAYELMKIVPEEIKSPNMTAEWEQKLETISHGEFTEAQFVNDIGGFIREVIATANKKIASSTPVQAFATPDNSLGKCPKCGHDVVRDKFGNASCSNYKAGCKFKIWSTVAGKKVTDTQVKALLSKGRTNVIKGFKSKSGKSFDAVILLDKEGNTSFEFPKKR